MIHMLVGKLLQGKDNKPIWIMNYSGRLLKQNYNYDFLIEALSKVTKEMPFRGPKEYVKGRFHVQM